MRKRKDHRETSCRAGQAEMQEARKARLETSPSVPRSTSCASATLGRRWPASARESVLGHRPMRREKAERDSPRAAKYAVNGFIFALLPNRQFCVK